MQPRFPDAFQKRKEMESDADNVVLLTNKRLGSGYSNPVFGILNIACEPVSIGLWKLKSWQLPSTVAPALLDDEVERTDSTTPKAFLVTATVVVFTATLLTILFPNVILQSINDQSDAYCAIFFVSFSCFLLMALAVVVAKFLWSDLVSLRPTINYSRIIKLAMYYGISGLSIFCGRDRFRVLCHLQDPLSAALLPFALICHLFFSVKLDSVRKLACIAVAIIGLFICVDYQIWDEFNCPGHVFTTINGDGMFWTSDEHFIWTAVYLVGLGLLVLFYTLLDKALRGNKAEYVISTIPMSASVVEKPSLSFMNTLVLCTWIQFFSWMTIAVLFWTDLFSFLARPIYSTTISFHEMMFNGIGCFLGIGEDCSRTAGLVWTFVVLSAVLFVAIVYLMVISADTCSVAYTFSLMSLALPLSTLWWSIFRIDVDGLRWSPKFNGETSFTLVGLPVMIAGLILYRHWRNHEKPPRFADA